MAMERLHSAEMILGKSSKEAFLYIIKENPQIERLTLTVYEPRIPNPEDLAKRIKSTETDEYIQVGRNISKDFLDTLIKNLPINKCLGINSNFISSKGRHGQIPILDFNCEINDANKRSIKGLIKMIKSSGFLIESGDSYHFIGDEIIVEDYRRYEEFLGKCLLSGLVDYRYVAHGLDRGFNTLRISYKNSTPKPKVIDIL